MAELDAKIEVAQERLKKLKAAKQKAEARARSAEKKKERSANLRKQILLGAWAIKTLDEATLKAKMDGYLTRPDDRKLFGL